MNRLSIVLSLVLSFVSIDLMADAARTYEEANQGYVSFDVSMPIDSTGFTLHGKNLEGGNIQFSDSGMLLSPLLASETGTLNPPVPTDARGNSYIKTTVQYNAIKFMNPNGINNLFIKVGMGKRTQQVRGLDPKVLKDGTYTWPAPIFAVGRETDTVSNKSTHMQFMQVGSLHGGPASTNVEYTQNFYVYSRGNGSMPISAQPIKLWDAGAILSKPFSSHLDCQVDGLWGGGGADPYRTLTGSCGIDSTTFPAGPNLDYDYGTITLPVVHTPWNAEPTDHCLFPGHKPHTGCVNASIGLKMHYIAQKIRVPINQHVALFAESGTAYRVITPTHLRYICTSNVYLKPILPQSDCLKRNYLTGGASYTYFAVGYEYVADDGTHYTAQYVNIPGQENGSRLAWLDASNTYIYAVGASNGPIDADGKNRLVEALDTIRQEQPMVYRQLGSNFLVPILKKNKLYAHFSAFERRR